MRYDHQQDLARFCNPLLFGKLHFLVIGFCCFLVALGAWMVPKPIVIVMCAIVPMLVAICIRKPFFICLLFIGFSFFRLHEAFPMLMPLRLPSLLAASSILISCIMLYSGRASLVWGKELKLFTALFLIMSIGVVFSSGRENAFAYWSDTYVKIAIMVFAISSMAQTPLDFGMALRSFVLFGFLVALVAIVNTSNSADLVEGTRVTIGRDFRSVLGDPNDLALVLLFPFSFALSLGITPGIPRLSKWFGRIAAVVIVAAVFATQSRGGILGLLAVGFVFCLGMPRKQAIYLSVIGGLPGMIFALHEMAVRISVARSGDSLATGSDESATGRLNMWWTATKMALDHPLMGVGLNNFRANNFFYNDHWDHIARAVHSTWFSVLSEGGFIAFGIFIVMVLAVGKHAVSTARMLSPERKGAFYDPICWSTARALTAGLAGFCVSGTFLTQGFTWPLYIILAMTVAIGRYAEKSKVA